jgi:precorrin-2 dehydrogenase / sirohydrochlorin ferrochelatase
MPARPALAVSLYVAGRRCVVVGDGAPAEERAARLTEAGANPDRIASAAYEGAALTGAFVEYCSDAALAPRVSRDARAAGALFYTMDLPDLSDFAAPAVARRGPLSLAVSTDGEAPALARRLRQELQRLLDAADPGLDDLLAEMIRVRAALPSGQERTDRLRALAERVALDGKLSLS